MEQAVSPFGKKAPAGLSGTELKVIAILSMLIDHLADTFFPGYGREWWLIGLHLIGRLAAPILWFMAAEGYRHTHNLKKYLLRLFVFAVVSHFAYAFCFGISPIPFRDSVLNQTSVIWPLFLAVVALLRLRRRKARFPAEGLAENPADPAAVRAGVSFGLVVLPGSLHAAHRRQPRQSEKTGAGDAGLSFDVCAGVVPVH